jgi:hydrogenase nickel incorporation protein HypA/HybF
MHELSIAQSIVDIIRENVPASDLPRVRSIHVRVGTMAGVVAESLSFCFEAVVADAGLSGAHLAIETVPLTARCRSCGQTGEIEPYLFRCGSCEGTDLVVVTGREMTVSEVELEEEEQKP